MKKRVSVYCGGAFNIGPASFAGACENIVLECKDIATCLMNKAKVVEILDDGTKVPLDFGNYNTTNGKTSITDDSVVITNKSKNQPVVKTVGIKYEAPAEVNITYSEEATKNTTEETAEVKTTVEETTATTTTEEETTTTATTEKEETKEDTTNTSNNSSNNNKSNKNNNYNAYKKSNK